MERETVVKQIAEEVILKCNSYHDATGRFTSKDKAGGVVRNLCQRVKGTYPYAGPAREVECLA